MIEQWKKCIVAMAMGLGLTGVTLAQQQATIKGEVRRVDLDRGKIAIKQDAVSDFQLPAMTLMYEISKGLLSGVKAGDKVKFTATQQNNRYIIDEIKVDN